MAAADPTSLTFDDVVIDFAGRRLVRGGAEQALEPKAFAVLALLASAPGQAFARDDILDAVWGHRHVTSGVLNRIMTLLRHALGEDAHAPRYLHTLHGVGYRFDLPLRPAPLPVEPAGEQRQRAERRVEQPASAVAGTRAVSPAGRQRWALPAAAVVVLAGLVAVSWRTLERQRPVPRGPSAAQVAAATPTLIVMPLESLGAGVASSELAAGLSDELISALARINGLRVIARESTGLATAQSTDVAGLVPRLGISHALEGRLRQSGEQLRIHVRLTEARSGRTLWAHDYDRDVADVLALQRDIAGAVADTLALELGLASGASPGPGGDAEFLRRYFAAQALLKPAPRRDESVERAESEFRALLRQRPDDARAHAGLAVALEVRAFRRPTLAAALRAEAAEEAALALRLDPDLADGHRVQAAAACRSNRWDECLARYARARALAPSDTQLDFQYAMALAALGYLDEAERVLRASVKRDPLNPGARFGYGRILDTLGRHAHAREHLELGAVFSPYGRWFNAVWRGDLGAAAEIAASLGQSDDAGGYERRLRPSYVATSRALVDPRLWPEAEAAMDEFERATGLMDFLRVLVPDARAARLIAGLDVVRERAYSSWDLLLWTRDLAYLRRDPAFQDYLRDNGILAHWQRHGLPPQCRMERGRAACE